MYNSSPSRNAPNPGSTSDESDNKQSLVVTKISEDFWIEVELDSLPNSLHDDLPLIITITNTGTEDIARGYLIGVSCDGFEYKQIILPDALPTFSEKRVNVTLKRKNEEKYVGRTITISGSEIELAHAEYPLLLVARRLLQLGQSLVNKNILLFGRRGSGKTYFLNHILPVFTPFQPTLNISKPKDEAVTLAFQKYDFKTLFKADLPLTLFDTYGLTDTNYGEAVFRFLIGGLLSVKHRPAEYGFTEKEEKNAFAALINPRKSTGQNPNVIDTVLFFVPKESTAEQIDNIKYYINIASSARKKAVVVITSRSDETSAELTEISTKFAENDCHVMHWISSSSFTAQQQVLHILLQCINN